MARSPARSEEWELAPAKDFEKAAADANDYGMDFVAWKPFPDQRIGRLTLLGQCACGRYDQESDDKAKELDPNALKTVFRRLTWLEPVRLFATPYHVNSPHRFKNCTRCRIWFLTARASPGFANTKAATKNSEACTLASRNSSNWCSSNSGRDKVSARFGTSYNRSRATGRWNRRQCFYRGSGYGFAKQGRHSIPDLAKLLILAAAELEPIRKPLQPRPLSHGQPPPPPVRQPHAQHVAGRAAQVAARHRAARHVQVKVARADALGRPFVPGHVIIHARGQDLDDSSDPRASSPSASPAV